MHILPTYDEILADLRERDTADVGLLRIERDPDQARTVWGTGAQWFVLEEGETRGFCTTAEQAARVALALALERSLFIGPR